MELETIADLRLYENNKINIDLTKNAEILHHIKYINI